MARGLAFCFPLFPRSPYSIHLHSISLACSWRSFDLLHSAGAIRLTLAQPGQHRRPRAPTAFQTKDIIKKLYVQLKWLLGIISKQHGVGRADVTMLPGTSYQRGDSTCTVKMPDAQSSPQDEHSSSKESANHWSANFAILLSRALMILTIHQMPNKQPPFHSFRGQMWLRQRKALLPPSSCRRPSFCNSSLKLIHNGSSLCSLPRSQTRFAQMVNYILCNKPLSKQVKHETQLLSTSS